MLDRLTSDVRVLFRKRLWFLSPEEDLPIDSVSIALTVGAVELGHIGFAASKNQERNEAYKRWLIMASKVFADELSSPQAHNMGAVPAKINRAARLIQERHEDPLSLGDVAGEVGLSRERLSRLFHESLGITFSEYLTQARLATAQERLRNSDVPITEIAYASGFQSLSQFNRSFAKVEGISPRQFRKATQSPSTRAPIS